MTAFARPRLHVPLAVGIVVLLLALVAIAVTAAAGGGGGTGAADVEETRVVRVEGAPLAAFESAAVDPAVGLAAPIMSGRSFDGTEVTVGEPSEIVVFLAHWCPHCQREVPVITDWLEAGGPPEGVSLVAVSTSVNPAAPNYPPSAWLEQEGWPVTTLADDMASSAGRAYGVTAFPGFVVIGPDGTVAVRGSGELTTAQLDGLAAAARG